MKVDILSSIIFFCKFFIHFYIDKIKEIKHKVLFNNKNI